VDRVWLWPLAEVAGGLLLLVVVLTERSEADEEDARGCMETGGRDVTDCPDPRIEELVDAPESLLLEDPAPGNGWPSTGATVEGGAVFMRKVGDAGLPL
jgi:hypothetical protein